MAETSRPRILRAVWVSTPIVIRDRTQLDPGECTLSQQNWYKTPVRSAEPSNLISGDSQTISAVASVFSRVLTPWGTLGQASFDPSAVRVNGELVYSDRREADLAMTSSGEVGTST